MLPLKGGNFTICNYFKCHRLSGLENHAMRLVGNNRKPPLALFSVRGKVVLIRTMADTVFGTAHFERALSMAGILTLALILRGRVKHYTAHARKVDCSW